ncbi:MAG: hypothetical protein IKZ82_06200 [Clostridia bacterium]|nr:hypothetical protein [Clostridia bacterium]
MAIQFINTYGVTIIYAILTFFAGYIGLAVKRIYNKYIDTKIKKDVVRTCVKAVEQIYKDLHGQDKYNKAVAAITELLNIKGITFTEFEIKMLIESTCQEFVKAVTEDDTEEETTEEV